MSLVSEPLRGGALAPVTKGRAAIWGRLGMGVILTVATVAAYRPALHGGLIIDDMDHVPTPDLQTPTGLWRIWSAPGTTPQYFPILHSAFWVEHRLWGDSLLGYHLTNV